MNDTAEREKGLDFLKKRSVGTLATLADAGGPRARTVHYVVNDSFEIFFLTLSGTRKVEDINHDHRAAFVVSDVEAPQTLQLEGVLVEQPDTLLADSGLKGLLDVLMKNGARFAPLTHLDAGKVLFYKITPTWIRWGDYTDGAGSERVFTEISA